MQCLKSGKVSAVVGAGEVSVSDMGMAEDLYTIVIEANRTIEKSMSKYYETLVMEQVNRNQARNGLPTPPKETA